MIILIISEAPWTTDENKQRKDRNRPSPKKIQNIFSFYFIYECVFRSRRLVFFLLQTFRFFINYAAIQQQEEEQKTNVYITIKTRDEDKPFTEVSYKVNTPFAPHSETKGTRGTSLGKPCVARESHVHENENNTQNHNPVNYNFFQLQFQTRSQKSF